MLVGELEFFTRLELKTTQTILTSIGSRASESCDCIERELISKLELDETILKSTVDPDTINPLTGASSVPPLSFLAFEPYVHSDFVIRFIELWREISRAHWTHRFLYVNILAGALLEGLLMLGLNVIDRGPNLRELPDKVLQDSLKDAWNLSWLIQVGGVNRMFDERTRQAFHRIRELRNDVHFLFRGEQYLSDSGLGDEENANFAINTIVEFVPKLKIWVQKRGTPKYT